MKHTNITLSTHFNLQKIQRELNFVDIVLEKDLPLFIDPHYLSLQKSELAEQANYYIQTFFHKLLNLIRNDKIENAKHHLDHIGEINEVHLGLSKGVSRGKGIGEENSKSLIKSLLTSEAMSSGLIENIEDTKIFIKGIGADKISDLCANILKKILLKYTEDQCYLWNIPMVSGHSGYFWEPESFQWINEPDTKRLLINGKYYVLVPKEFVTYKSGYTPDQYRQHFVLNFLQSEHLRINSSLVRVRRDKKTNIIIEKYVTKKSIVEYLNSKGENINNKEWLLNFTLENKSVFEEFKKKAKISGELFNGEKMSPEEIGFIVDALIDNLESIPPGNPTFHRYEDAIKGIAELLFYPDLTNPIKQARINDGRKVVDLVFTNIAKDGIFYRLKKEDDYPCLYVAMECKNYSKELVNPELDQMLGRFSNNRGKVGIIFCRNLDNPALFLKRTQDAFKDGRGLIIHLTDGDLINLLNIYKKDFEFSYREYISNLVDKVRYA